MTISSDLNISKSAQILSSYFNSVGKGAVSSKDIKDIATDKGGKVPKEAKEAASYVLNHDGAFTAIETLDVNGEDDWSGTWNLDDVANGALDNTAENAIWQMTDVFDKAISMAAEITDIKTDKSAGLDGAKQRPNN